MSDNNNFRALLEKAKEMQENMQKAQAELTNLTVEGSSGAGLVKVELNGRYEAKALFIDPTLFQGDKKVLEDLMIAAFNAAVAKVEEGSRQKVAEITKGLQLPEGFAGMQGGDDSGTQ